MKILITGTSGHLGEALARILLSRGQEYLGVDLLPSPFTHRVGTITDPEFVMSCMEGMDAVIHAATLHKPHIVTHSKQDFITTNITGTLNLLEAARLHQVSAFVMTSTTSTFGDAMRPASDAPAVLVTEELVPQPKNIYGVTKTAAEDLCQLYARNHQLPCLILRTSRFFPEEDDDATKRSSYVDANIKVNEYLHRRADVADMASAHLLAVEKAATIGFDRLIITADTPFNQMDLRALRQNAPNVVARYFPEYEEIYQKLNWQMFPTIGRVYVNEKAKRVLGWKPQYGFQQLLQRLEKGLEFRSPLTLALGKKGYHEETFEEGPYPV